MKAEQFRTVSDLLGLDFHHVSQHGKYAGSEIIHIVDGYPTAFNPLHDNGDCLWMCAQLGISIIFCNGNRVDAWAPSEYMADDTLISENYSNHGMDKLAAARYVALKAAMHIAKAKGQQ